MGSYPLQILTWLLLWLDHCFWYLFLWGYCLLLYLLAFFFLCKPEAERGFSPKTSTSSAAA